MNELLQRWLMLTLPLRMLGVCADVDRAASSAAADA